MKTTKTTTMTTNNKTTFKKDGKKYYVKGFKLKETSKTIKQQQPYHKILRSDLDKICLSQKLWVHFFPAPYFLGSQNKYLDSRGELEIIIPHPLIFLSNSHLQSWFTKKLLSDVSFF